MQGSSPTSITLSPPISLSRVSRARLAQLGQHRRVVPVLHHRRASARLNLCQNGGQLGVRLQACVGFFRFRFCLPCAAARGGARRREAAAAFRLRSSTAGVPSGGLSPTPPESRPSAKPYKSLPIMRRGTRLSACPPFAGERRGPSSAASLPAAGKTEGRGGEERGGGAGAASATGQLQERSDRHGRPGEGGGGKNRVGVTPWRGPPSPSTPASAPSARTRGSGRSARKEGEQGKEKVGESPGEEKPGGGSAPPFPPSPPPEACSSERARTFIIDFMASMYSAGLMACAVPAAPAAATCRCSAAICGLAAIDSAISRTARGLGPPLGALPPGALPPGALTRSAHQG